MSGVLLALDALNSRSSCLVCVWYGVCLVWLSRLSFSLFSHHALGYPLAYCTHFFAHAGTRDCRVVLAFGECAFGYYQVLLLIPDEKLAGAQGVLVLQFIFSLIYQYVLILVVHAVLLGWGGGSPPLPLVILGYIVLQRKT